MNSKIPHHEPLYKDSKILLLSIVTSGLTLIPLLPIGAFFGLGALFKAFSVLHWITILAATVLSLIRIFNGDLSANGRRKYGDILCRIVVAAAIASLIPLLALPVTAVDAHVHHLAIPQLWFRQGSIYEIPWHEWSYYPMLLNLGYLSLYVFGIEQFATAYHFSFLILLAALVKDCAAWCFKTKISANLSVLLVVSLPAVLRLAVSPLVDLGLGVFCLAGLILLYRGNIALSGIAIGLAASTKLNGGLFAAMLIGFISFLVVTKRIRIFQCALFICAFAITYSPWCIRNFLWTGNPVFPQLKSTLGGSALVLSHAPTGLPPLLLRHEIYGESLGQLLLLPLRIFYSGSDGDPRLFDGALSPLLLLSIAALIATKEFFVRWGFGALSWFYVFAALIYSSARVRYLIPIVGELSALSILGVDLLLVRSSSVIQKVCFSLVTIICTLTGAAYISDQLYTPVVRLYLTDRISKDEYLSQTISEYQLTQFVNRELPVSARVYLLGTSNRFALFEVDTISRGYFSSNEIISWLKSGESAESIFRKFQSLGVTHIFLNAGRVELTLAPILTEKERSIWNDFLKTHLKGIASNAEYSIWELQ